MRRAAFADDVELQFGRHPVAVGRDAALTTLGAVSGSFTGVSHTFRHVWESGDTAVCEFEATYTLHGGEQVTMPTAVVITRRGDEFVRVRMYLDEGALVA